MGVISGFLDELCQFTIQLRVLLVASLFGIGLTLVLFVVGDFSRATNVIIVLNLAGLVPLSLFSGLVLLRCRRRI
ncbi:hypothetical protein [Halococcus agarilyticus]|uniref:hypothetical protein n=1 Tax=Halococcus agarilyticus TaxID=1232219 RepID=UPI000677B365|nr:hypothetical protein [Halococcus agarilyticus]